MLKNSIGEVIDTEDCQKVKHIFVTNLFIIYLKNVSLSNSGLSSKQIFMLSAQAPNRIKEHEKKGMSIFVPGTCSEAQPYGGLALSTSLEIVSLPRRDSQCACLVM